MPKFFGCHVSCAGGLEQALINGDKLGVNSIQLHPSPPQKWNSKPFPEKAEEKFLALRETSGVKRIFFHGIYLINLANPDPSKQQIAKLSLVHYLDLMQRIGGDGVVFHVGSLKDEPDQETGFNRVAAAIDWIFKESKGDSRLILEVAAGAGSVIGDKLEELKSIFDKVSDTKRLGFGLDTQHMWASGYDWKTNLSGVVSEIESQFGLDKVWLIHLNDSMTELGSNKDRHQNLGQGLIGEAALKEFFLHKKFEDVPFVLETPALKDIETAKDEVLKLRGWSSAVR